eukprot:scaffold1541_cov256-Pinguiococcus_pyrenoidosus.AAC.48
MSVAQEALLGAAKLRSTSAPLQPSGQARPPSMDGCGAVVLLSPNLNSSTGSGQRRSADPFAAFFSSSFCPLALQPLVSLEMASANLEHRNQDATCYCGNLDDRVTEEVLWELMLQVRRKRVASSAFAAEAEEPLTKSVSTGRTD